MQNNIVVTYYSSYCLNTLKYKYLTTVINVEFTLQYRNKFIAMDLICIFPIKNAFESEFIQKI